MAEVSIEETPNAEGAQNADEKPILDTEQKTEELKNEGDQENKEEESNANEIQDINNVLDIKPQKVGKSIAFTIFFLCFVFISLLYHTSVNFT